MRTWREYRKHLRKCKYHFKRKIEIDRENTTGRKWNERPNTPKKNATWGKLVYNIR